MKKKRFIDVIEVCTNDSHLFSGDIWREREREWRYSIVSFLTVAISYPAVSSATKIFHLSGQFV